MAEVTKTMAGFALAVALIAGFVANGLISTDTPLWKCDSTGKISDCINGVKADGMRCYWNATNAAKYMKCPEKWHSYQIPMSDISIMEPVVRTEQSTYQICDLNKCTIKD